METYSNIHVTSTTTTNKNIRMIYETGWGYQACTQWCDIVFFLSSHFLKSIFGHLPIPTHQPTVPYHKTDTNQ